ncbi:MAG: nitrous oxide reductase accessory protein NosL, partial [Thermomicrobiales bacterium]|nr:nitrous oxide reductase accessory protein NosL [Thermomicrobiales bacterium]
RRRVLLGLLAAPLLLSGCGPEQASAMDPPRIDYGRVTCDRCGMIVTDERHAAGLVEETGDAAIFDDAGELIATVQEQQLGSRRAWVHDYPSSRWIDGVTALYAVGKGVTSPMGTGVVAFAERKPAEAFAAEQGAVVMTWDEVLADWTPDPRMS